MNTRLDDLDVMFDLPTTSVTDPKLRSLYEILVHRLKKEAEGCPSETLQAIRLERMVALYVKIKEYDAQGSLTIKDQKDLNSFFLTTLEQFDKALKKKTPEELREDITRDVLRSVIGVLNSITDVKLRQALRVKFESALKV